MGKSKNSGGILGKLMGCGEKYLEPFDVGLKQALGLSFGI